jgi:serine O-acetyltransferase
VTLWSQALFFLEGAMIQTALEDVRAVKRNDPAAHGWLEIVLCHTPLHAILLYRLAHWIHGRLGLRLIARLLSVVARFWTGVEIHPGAQIGRGFFLDHGAGVVIGETATIGDHCVMFHNVTLGGTGKYRGRRHPNVGHHRNERHSARPDSCRRPCQDRGQRLRDQP